MKNALKVSIILSIIGFYFNLPIASYSFFGNNELRLYDFFMLLPISYYLLSIIVKKEKFGYSIIENNYKNFILYVFVSFLFFTTIFYIFEFNVIRWLMGLLYFYHLLGFWIISYLSIRFFRRETIFKIITICLLFNIIVLVSQYFGFIGHIWSAAYVDSYQTYSAFLGPNRITPGMTMFFGFCLFTQLSYFYKNIFLRIMQILCLICVLLIGSRTTVLALIVYIIYFIVKKRLNQPYIVIILTVIALNTVDVFKDRFDSFVYNRITKKVMYRAIDDDYSTRIDRVTSNRYRVMNNYIEKIKNEVWTIPFGRGFNNRFIGGALSAHNQYLSLLFELGIIGLFLFVKWLLSMLYWRPKDNFKIANNALIFSMIITLFGGDHLYIYRPLFAILGQFLLIISLLRSYEGDIKIV